MRSAVLCSLLIGLSGCSGGGGTGTAAPPVRLVAAPIEIAPAATTADLIVALADLPATPPTLLQLAVVLPPALTVAAVEPLQKLQAMPTLDGAARGDRYLVVCGDDRNASGQALVTGPLFRLRLAVASPRQAGAQTVSLTELLAANDDGSAAAVQAAPTLVTVTVR